MQPGEINLGGDGSRLYFYDPVRYLQSTLMYAIQTIGINKENPLYLFLPFNILLILLNQIISSSLIVTLFNSFQIVVAFLAMYAISRELIGGSVKEKKYDVYIELSALFVGMYYVLSPLMVRTEWDRAIFTHARIFLGPLMFFLVLQYLLTKRVYFLLLTLLTTFIFSVNFSWAGAPSLFSFYPLAFFYTFLYVRFIRKKTIPYIALFLGAISFIALHAFHIFPLLYNFMGKGGLAYEKIFKSGANYDSGIDYFLGSARSIHLTENLTGLPQLVKSIIPYDFMFFFTPLFLILGLLINGAKNSYIKDQRKNFLFLFTFFLICVFFATATITDAGFEFYKSLFRIPGFSMFRNYYGHWALPYLFFLSLLTGHALFYIFTKINTSKRNVLFFFLVSLVTVSALPFIRGDMIDIVLTKKNKNEFKVPIKMDPVYEEVLTYVRINSIDGKYMTLPHTESFNQVLIGSQNGMYIGPSTFSHLAGKSDFNGYQVISPFNEAFLKLSREKDYKSIGVLFSILNIKYIFHNSDPRVLEYFEGFPYPDHLKKSLPNNQVSYTQFITELPVKKDRSFGPYYNFYSLTNDFYLPHIYLPQHVVYYDKKLDPWMNLTDVFFTFTPEHETRTAYIDNALKGKLNIVSPTPKITFTKINPTKYRVNVEDVRGPYVLVFLDMINSHWSVFLSEEQSQQRTPMGFIGEKAKNILTFFGGQENLQSQKQIASYFDGAIKEGEHKNVFLDQTTFETWGKQEIAKDMHFEANAYANAWYITPEDTNKKNNYTLIIEMTTQRVFYLSSIISLITLLVCTVWLCIVVGRKLYQRVS